MLRVNAFWEGWNAKSEHAPFAFNDFPLIMRKEHKRRTADSRTISRKVLNYIEYQATDHIRDRSPTYNKIMILMPKIQAINTQKNLVDPQVRLHRKMP